MQSYRDTSRDIDFPALLGKVVLCRKGDNKEFVSRLVAIEGDQLIFSTRNGKLIPNPRASITFAVEV